MKKGTKKQVVWILILSVLLALLVFLGEYVFTGKENLIQRNTYGAGSKTEAYELTVEDELEGEPFQIEVEERAYTKEETDRMFQEVIEKLDEVVLGENETFDRVEKNLHLVTALSEFPVRIQWELDSYDVMDIEGNIKEEYLSKTGKLVCLQGTISYGKEQTTYVRYAYVYPLTREGADKLIYEIEQELRRVEEETREDESFSLPTQLNGKKLEWKKKVEPRWQYILLVGIVLAIFLIYREQEKVRRQKKQRREALARDYPGMISKLTLLLGTGSTVKSAWEKIVQNYEAQKEEIGERVLYEEMLITLREISGGISETEAYERFGKRCQMAAYMKFGTLLSQNLRKGGKGLSEMLRVEAIQSFENRKNAAKRLGEEAGTKLLMPMLGMLAVVLIMVMVPALLTMQI